MRELTDEILLALSRPFKPGQAYASRTSLFLARCFCSYDPFYRSNSLIAMKRKQRDYALYNLAEFD
jgi:hypothetical protein